ncbi:ferric reductase-like transmembrane domain-containing protein [Pleurocapsales cyanobacterium LEGE 10410]|nr:ferric reductase-like transmembrane domain-containing protein [Pleurocapsales cyanobacterium LEGE 10410]
MTYNSLCGFITLIVYIATIFPSNIVKIFPKTKKYKLNRLLLQHRRSSGLAAFFLASNHAVISLGHYGINLLDLSIYQNYYSGLSIYVIFALLAITSNNWSLRKLKRKWKKLHQLTYLAMLLLFWHILSAMENSWSLVTSISLLLLSVISVVYAIRLISDFRKNKQKKVEI